MFAMAALATWFRMGAGLRVWGECANEPAGMEIVHSGVNLHIRICAEFNLADEEITNSRQCQPGQKAVVIDRGRLCVQGMLRAPITWLENCGCHFCRFGCLEFESRALHANL